MGGASHFNGEPVPLKKNTLGFRHDKEPIYRPKTT
jgi:hypothetical protein